MKRRGKMWEVCASRTFLWLLMPVAVAALQLPPEIQADRYLLEAEKEIQEQDYASAKDALDRILALQVQHGLDLPEQFFFRYAEVMERLGLYDGAVEHVMKYLMLTGQDGEHYREALELLNAAEEAKAAAEAAARDATRRAEAAKAAAKAEQQRAEAQRREIVELTRRQVEEAQVALPRDELRSGGLGPEMVRIASGRFQYYTSQENFRPNLQWVVFDRSFAISRYEVTRGEFEKFVDSTRYRTEAEQAPRHGCDGPHRNVKFADKKKTSLRWNRPGFDQTDSHPVTCVSTRDAIAYAEWLSRETGHTYRLPSAAEWQYAARAGSSAAILFPENDEDLDDTKACSSGNLRDYDSGERYAVKCSDGVRRTAEVGRFMPNDVGLYDMVGNVAELVLACAHLYYEQTFLKLTTDGSPEHPDSCDKYVVSIGSSWDSGELSRLDFLAWSAIYANPYREVSRPSDGLDGYYYRRSSTTWAGFRVVRDLTK